ncbi:hypothetical protein FGA82_07360 [Pseudomonas fluorescens]|uniref:hypothetical protein n=1 Tax=Pseudomonas fluorescens TaxID=294 RepID=UPI0011311909|nr:hypothetical protein [Pseudomonas fluorescens]TMU81370.1 hypothetical protein FGA82_07360 [Pseudomonas fluorescens]
MNESQRQARLMRAQTLIIEAIDATEARTRTAYLHGYLDGLLVEGHISVSNAQSLKTVATEYRDMRLTALGAAPVPNPPQGEDYGRPYTADQEASMTWWNILTVVERQHWMAEARNTGLVADAWAAYKRAHD